MKKIAQILNNIPGIDDYRITSTNTLSHEVFFVHSKLETVRSTDTTDTAVTVYVSHDGKLGDSTFSVYGSMSDEEIANKATAAINRAQLVFNEPYDLPAGEVGEFALPSNFSDYTMPELAAKIADAVFAAEGAEGGSLNAVEIFVYKDTVNVLTSRGIDKTQVKYHAMIEAIPTWTENGDSVELYEDFRFTEFDSDAVTAEISRKMEEVRARYTAEKPESPITANVVLNVKEIMSLISELAGNMNYSIIYSHANLFKQGDDIQKGDDCDKLTVTLRGQLAGSTRSGFFDEDGVTLTDKVLIEDGKVVGSYGMNRFACYLGEKATGNLRCVELAGGTLNDDGIKAAPYVECISLSGLQLDLYNDYIGGEIRLAYYYDGSSVKPITGISMSAKLSEVLATLRLSEKIVSTDGYKGPEKLLLRDVAII